MTETRIMIGYNGGEESRDALACGARLAEDVGGRLILAAAFPHLRAHAGSEAFELALGRKSDPLFAEARADLGPMLDGIPVHERSVGGAPVASLLTRLAQAEDADVIVLGSTHRGPLARTLLGSVGERVIRAAPCPVAVVPRGYAEWPIGRMRILGAAYDGTPDAERAVRQATALARRISAELRVLAMVEPLSPADIAYSAYTADDPEPRFSRELLERATDDLLASLPSDVNARRLILSGEPAQTLATKGSELVDALVIGSHADTPIVRAFVGSVSTPVVRTASCPVVVVPSQAAVGFGAWDGEPPVRLAWGAARARMRRREAKGVAQ